ncbi:hypothetical protein DUNSADRAFT_1471 [Dunaliella salina]|uniref:Secreted protein n=1 Tax=Dunaliella salina TaxID=3046 RepID=A0ABQ7GX21_DUNSA|nr:hypothetical protein DUNSADRAFT_1471 [Dunaliella salina]|eukprot:KAF5839158.1 hypothetical protein DUNSADRAFT_1471 [Dunaliella salina]
MRASTFPHLFASLLSRSCVCARVHALIHARSAPRGMRWTRWRRLLRRSCAPDPLAPLCLCKGPSSQSTRARAQSMELKLSWWCVPCNGSHSALTRSTAQRCPVGGVLLVVVQQC